MVIIAPPSAVHRLNLGFAFLIIAHQFDQRGDVVVARAIEHVVRQS